MRVIEDVVSPVFNCRAGCSADRRYSHQQYTDAFAKTDVGRRAARILVLAIALGIVPGVTAQSTAPDEKALAKAIVEKADDVRFPHDGFEVGVSIESTGSEGTTETRRYRVLSKGGQNTIVMTLEPASDRGQAMLIRGRDLWLYLPTVSQPVRLSLSQRLTGQVANGDIARANFAGDYDATLLRTEVIDGEPMYVLELIAVDRSVTYQKVVYWVRQTNHRPFKAEFYSLSDRLLKTCLYEEYKQLGGRLRPTRLVMTDALHKGDTSILEYRDMRMRDLPDKMFTKDYLKRLD